MHRAPKQARPTINRQLKASLSRFPWPANERTSTAGIRPFPLLPQVQPTLPSSPSHMTDIVADLSERTGIIGAGRA